MWNICQKNITSLVFPTAWQSIPPHLTAVGFHSGLFFIELLYEMQSNVQDLLGVHNSTTWLLTDIFHPSDRVGAGSTPAQE